MKDEANSPRVRRVPEVLAPAGDEAALDAALRAGADAVYFGLDEGFNARARAANFGLAGLPDLVARIHRAGARAYLTLNTLVFEPELYHVERVLAAAARAGVDALIVQDPAVALLARVAAPDLELHASTQMTVCSPEAVPFAKGLGIRRVVVPRELSVDEIEEYARQSDVELEVFIHGALCVSWSGQCLTSEAWSGRSANRGQCAQSCRLPYTLVLDGERRDLGDVRYLLSPKDLAGGRAVERLMQIGVHGLKIEGRQKSALYVATATRGYRNLVDGLASCSRAADRRAITREYRNELGDMALAFSRGFSDGFLAGSDHQSLVEGRFPKHRGILLGKVISVRGAEVFVLPDPAGRPWTGALASDASDRADGARGAVSTPLAAFDAPTDAAVGPALPRLEPRPGMGVVFDAGDPEDKHEPGGPIFTVRRRRGGYVLGFGRPGPDLERVRAGQRVWLTRDPVAARAAVNALDRVPRGRRILDLTITGRPGAPLRVVARCGTDAETVESALLLTRASGDGLTTALLDEKLGAFGGTPFTRGALEVSGLDEGLFLPVSELKAMRRALVGAWMRRMDAPAERARTPTDSAHRAVPIAPSVRESLRLPEDDPSREAPDEPGPALFALVRDDAQLDAAIDAGLPEVDLDWMELAGLKRAVERARARNLRVNVATLRVQKPGETRFLDAVTALEPDGILVRHLAALVRLARRPAPRPSLHGDFSLNVTNSLTARHLLRQGLDTLTFSHDLDEAQLLALVAHAPARRFTLVLRHRVAAFHTEHCVYAHLLSAGRDYHTCGRPCERHAIGLEDDAGRCHPVLVDAGCRNTVFNAEVQTSAEIVPRLLAAGVRRFRLEFTRESGGDVVRIVEHARDLLAGRVEATRAAHALGTVARIGFAGRMAIRS